jgi:hypothetical protein
MPKTPELVQTNDAQATTASPALSIDVLNDLDSASSLVSLLSSQHGAIFEIASEVAKFKGKPVKNAAAAKASGQITLNVDAAPSEPVTWTLPNGIVFSLIGSATCGIGIDTVSESIAVTTDIDSEDTTNIVAGPKDGIAYINIDLDFSVQGTVGAGTAVGALGISGTVAGGRTATLSFCQPVDDSLDLETAIKTAFSQIVFPLSPTAIKDLQTGSLTRIVFDGTFSAELDFSYGLSDHTFAAPSVDDVLLSVAKVVDLSPPSVELSSGLSASITYTHTDHFALIIDKTSDTVATVSLARALGDDAGLSAGFQFAVTVTNINVSVDGTLLQQTVKHVTGSDGLASAVAGAATAGGNDLLSGLNGKLNSWATDVSSEIGLTAGLDRQTNRATLFNFEADLANPALTEASWKALLAGDIFQALKVCGLTLQPGSGVSQSLKRSATIHFQFFNLFSFDQVSDFFQNASAELGTDGSIRLHARIGEELKDTTNTTLSALRIYFVASANENTARQVTGADVDLRVELKEANRPGRGATFADTLATAPGNPAILKAQQAIGTFLGGHPKAKLTILYELQPSAYTKLSFSPFNGKNPSPLPQSADRANWTAFQKAATTLNIAPSSVANLTYDNWVAYNQAAIDQPGSNITPDRTQAGDIASGKLALPDNNQRDLVAFFMEASQGFMNLIADLRTLADQATAASDIDSYNDLLTLLTNIIKQDVLVDYLVPIAGALLHQSSVAGTTIATSIDQAADNSALTCTITLS